MLLNLIASCAKPDYLEGGSAAKEHIHLTLLYYYFLKLKFLVNYDTTYLTMTLLVNSELRITSCDQAVKHYLTSRHSMYLTKYHT